MLKALLTAFLLTANPAFADAPPEGTGAQIAQRASEQTVSGSFKGLNQHTVSGGVEVRKDGDHYVIVFKDDFVFDGAPDPKVGFGANGRYDRGTTFAPLKKDLGAQIYRVPAHIDVSQYNEVHIWCEQFTVDLAVAALR